MRSLVLGLALALAACGTPAHFQPGPDPTPSPTVIPTPAPSVRAFLFGLRWVGPTLLPAYADAAIKAADDWNTAIGQPVFGWSESGAVVLSQEPERPQLGDLIGDGLTVETIYPVGTLVLLNGAVPPNAAYPVVAHELGHVIGLKHSTDYHDLMFSKVWLASRITPHDAERAKALLAEQEHPQ